MLGKEVSESGCDSLLVQSGTIQECAVAHPKPHSKVQLELRSPDLLFFSFPHSTHYPELWGKFVFRSL